MPPLRDLLDHSIHLLLLGGERIRPCSRLLELHLELGALLPGPF